MYYCKFNKCETRSKQLIYGSINKALFPPTPTESSETDTTNLFTSEHNTIRKEPFDLSEKVLCSMNKNLQQEIKSSATSIAQTPATQSAPAALSIIDEISGRDR